MPYTPHTEQEIKLMLEAVGVARIEELWASIPDRVRLRRELALPAPLAESELFRLALARAGQNQSGAQLRCFLGGGTYYHYIPPALFEIIGRSEFYTAYTPYQPEVSQGTLQAIFEFQTMVCELTGMEVANASMYDGASATAEAALMAERMRPKNQRGPILIARSANPLYRATLKTYCARLNREIIELPFDPGAGTLDLERAAKLLPGALALIVQSPNYFGAIEDLAELSSAAHGHDAIMIAVVTEAMSLGLLEPPGRLGADVVVANGQSLGAPMGFGGPHLGLFACRQDDARKMPGRLVGQTVDHDGRPGYVLTLATREQHIRRAKATSNICSNQGLMALSAAVYMTLLGPAGLAETAAQNRARCEYLKAALARRGLGRLGFSAPGFNEFSLDLGRDPRPAIKAMLKQGFLAGVPLGPHYPEAPNALLVAVTETLVKDDLDAYVQALAAAVK